MSNIDSTGRFTGVCRRHKATPLASILTARCPPVPSRRSPGPSYLLQKIHALSPTTTSNSINVHIFQAISQSSATLPRCPAAKRSSSTGWPSNCVSDMMGASAVIRVPYCMSGIGFLEEVMIACVPSPRNIRGRLSPLICGARGGISSSLLSHRGHCQIGLPGLLGLRALLELRGLLALCTISS